MRQNKKLKCGVYGNIAKNLVFIDGVPRAGKSLFSGVISSLENFEHIQFYTLPELIIPALSLGLVTADFARAVLRLHMDELVYNILLSRGVNFRHTDQTGIFNFKEPKIYLARLAKEDGNEIIEDLLSTKRFIPFRTHDLLVNLEHLNKLDMDYKMLALFRHPVDTCYSWWKNKIGERFDNDPRLFVNFYIDYNAKPVPWYCAGYEREWVRLNPMERCVRIVTDIVPRSVRQYEKATNKSRIHLMVFEEFLEEPRKELEKICLFIGTNTTVHTERFLREVKCPRVLDPKERRNKLAQLKSGINKKLFNNLMEMSESYESDIYGLR